MESNEQRTNKEESPRGRGHKDPEKASDGPKTKSEKIPGKFFKDFALHCQSGPTPPPRSIPTEKEKRARMPSTFKPVLMGA